MQAFSLQFFGISSNTTQQKTQQKKHMMTTPYKTKKELKENIGKALRYTETSFFGPEYKSTGTFCVTNHPKRSWFAAVTMENDIIKSVK